MASVMDVPALAFYLAEGCTKILVPLLRFLGRPSMRNPAVDEAAVFLLILVLLTAYVAGVIVAHFAGVVLAYLHLAAPAPASATTASSVCLGQFLGLFFSLLFAWLLVIAVQLAAFFFLGAIGQGFSCNVLG